MPSSLDLPRKFTTEDPVALKRELERMTQSLDRYLRDLQIVNQTVPLVTKLNPDALTFGQISPVVARDGQTVVVQLPRPSPENLGRRCALARATKDGEILVVAVDCLVAGSAVYRVANDIQLVEFVFLGGYFPTRFGAGAP